MCATRVLNPRVFFDIQHTDWCCENFGCTAGDDHALFVCLFVRTSRRRFPSPGHESLSRPNEQSMRPLADACRPWKITIASSGKSRRKHRCAALCASGRKQCVCGAVQAFLISCACSRCSVPRPIIYVRVFLT